MRYKTSILVTLALLFGFTLLPAQTQKGKATYYSKRSTGARTANGERLHHDSLTCAHRTYPFGTLLKVTNLSNNKWVVVKVTDRGPYARGRIIDLSWRAAKELDLISKGVATVKVEKYTGAPGIPYRPADGVNLPEIDFEITEAGYSFADDWAERAKQNDPATAAPKKRAAKPHGTKKSAAQKSVQKPGADKGSEEKKEEGTVWSNIFQSIKKKGEEIF